ncbi:MAG: hypothetical protein BZY81_03890 [SAR202 cluster bacterium Io17-Chloro-G4]|nr:MAG: hypothetical protein BZY81_03890 [SAR202 cluster bacterium Io17-Chloro-G4]
MNQNPDVLDIGEGQWKEAPYQSWVSNTDVIEHLRCPYKVYMSHAQGMPYSQFLTAARRVLVKAGIEFEEGIVSAIGIQKSVDIEREREADLLVRPAELIRNHDLGIQGRLDGLATENAVLVPIEIKSHRRVLRSDRVELAFYWRLLEPLREGNPDSKGYIVLNDGARIELDLRRRDFNRLDQAVTEVRRIREEGSALAVVPACKSCVFADEHLGMVRKAGDLSLVRDIGPPRRNWLLQSGVDNVGDFAESDINQLWHDWSQSDRYAPTQRLLREMQAHARALVSGDVQFIGDGAFPFLDTGILLDLEYVSGQCVFVVGAAVFRANEEPKMYQWFAKRIRDEGHILESLSQMLAEFPDYWIVTWNGKSADFPQLRRGWVRNRLSEALLADFERRHIDAYEVAYKNVRFPVPGFELSNISDYFGHRRKHRDLSRQDMPLLYVEYLRTRTASEKQSLQGKILSHNEDDLIGLLQVWRGLQQIVLANLA